MRRPSVAAALGALALCACTTAAIGPSPGPSDAGASFDGFVSDAAPSTAPDAGDATATTSLEGGSLAIGPSFNGFAVGAPLEAGTFTLTKPAFNLSRSCAGTMCITGSF